MHSVRASHYCLSLIFYLGFGKIILLVDRLLIILLLVMIFIIDLEIE